MRDCGCNAPSRRDLGLRIGWPTWETRIVTVHGFSNAFRRLPMGRAEGQKD
jgi:hypothetical protein